MNATKQEVGRFRIGDWVRFRYGTKDMFAQVVEVRGPIGVNRRHIYGIRVPRESMEADFFELPEDELEEVSRPSDEAIIQYLTTGGLVDILRHNLSGGKPQPRVWLNYNPRGTLKYTFNSESGIIGGATIPFAASYGEKIFSPKRDEIVKFLESFGLSSKNAEEVVATIGTAP